MVPARRVNNSTTYRSTEQWRRHLALLPKGFSVGWSSENMPILHRDGGAGAIITGRGRGQGLGKKKKKRCSKLELTVAERVVLGVVVAKWTPTLPLLFLLPGVQP